MFDISEFNFSFRPDLQLEDNAGRFWVENDDEELEQYNGSHLIPGTGADGKTRIDYLGELEVAQIGVESTLSDSYWVTMHRDGDAYRLVFRSEIPEYDEDQSTSPRFHSIPSFGEMLYALDHLTLECGDAPTHGWVQGTIAGITISSISSTHYPQLEEWYFAVQDHFFMTGELVYVDDPLGEKIRIVKHAEPKPERRSETTPGSGSFFAAEIESPKPIEQMFRPDGDEKS